MSRPIHQSLKRPAQCVQEYVGEASDAYKSWLTILACCTCDPCLCCKIDDIKKSTYVAVWENKMEFNYPEFHCCCMVDKVGMIYYDRAIISKLGRAGVCKPACTHCSCCPTCCDICGEGMVMYGQSCFSSARTTMPGAAGMCCCRSWTLMPFLRDVDNLVIALDAARDAALARAQGATAAAIR